MRWAQPFPWSVESLTKAFPEAMPLTELPTTAIETIASIDDVSYGSAGHYACGGLVVEHCHLIERRSGIDA